jgi:hypothetical protein
MVWIIDCWSVHISVEFRNWIKIKHTNILLILVLANYTSELQLTDVIL